MLVLLLLLACGGTEPTAPADNAPAADAKPEKKAKKVKKGRKGKKAKRKAAPATINIPNAAWEGTWVKGDKFVSIEKRGETLQVELQQDGDTVMSGPLEGEKDKGTAHVPLDGCGATITLSEVGGDLKVDLDGPECPVEWIGDFINTVSP